MTNEELADWLNAELAGRANEIVTRDIVRQWVTWGVLPRAVGHGQRIGAPRAWSRDDAALAQARRLVDLRAAGLRGQQALQAQLWLESWPVDFQRARAAITGIFERSKKRMLRGVSTNYDPRTKPPLSPAKQRVVVGQIGMPAAIFENSPLALFPDEKVAAFAATKFGEASQTDFAEIAARVIKSIFPEAEIPSDDIGLTGLLGMLGERDEIPELRQRIVGAGQSGRIRAGAPRLAIDLTPLVNSCEFGLPRGGRARIFEF